MKCKCSKHTHQTSSNDTSSFYSAFSLDERGKIECSKKLKNDKNTQCLTDTRQIRPGWSGIIPIFSCFSIKFNRWKVEEAFQIIDSNRMNSNKLMAFDFLKWPVLILLRIWNFDGQSVQSIANHDRNSHRERDTLSTIHYYFISRLNTNNKNWQYLSSLKSVPNV